MVARRRAKLGGTENWFVRRRGGEKERAKKDQGWRGSQGQDRAPTSGGRGRRTLTKYPNPNNPQPTRGTPMASTNKGEEKDREPKVITTLLVPYTMGSKLKNSMQKTEDEFRLLVGGPRVRLVEQGGDILSHLLGRNDPWASRRTCGDKQCVPCRSRVWLQSQQKEAKKN